MKKQLQKGIENPTSKTFNIQKAIESKDALINDSKRCFSLLNEFRENGFDTTEIYDDDVIDVKVLQKMNENFQNLTINDIILHFEKKVLSIKSTFHKNVENVGQLLLC